MNKCIRLLAAATALFAASVGWAQTSGTILGTVTDPGGAVIVGAKVTVVNERTGESRNVATDNTGGFSFPSLQPGGFTVRIESSGFQKYESKSNVLSSSERLTLGTIQLTIGAVSDTVSVVAEGTRVQTASSEGSALLTTAQIDSIAQKGRVLTNYLLLLPGVATNGGTSDAASGFVTVPNANGLSNQMMTISVDGLQGSDLGSQNLFQGSQNPDSVEEIKVLLNNYQAEYGRNGGATVNLITKSGTRDFHGTAYWYKRHEMFNANSFFNNRSGLAKTKYRFNTRGATLGGPGTIPGLRSATKDKLFFFYSYDDNPSTTTPASSSKTTMPTALERNGDFSQSFAPSATALALMPVRDPASGANFPGNIIPASRIDKNGQALLNVFSIPNQLNRAVTLGAYNNEFFNVVPNVRPGHVFKIDYKPTANDSLYFRGSLLRFQSLRSSVTGWDFARNSFSGQTKSAVLGYTRILNSNMVNEFTSGIRRPEEITTIDDNKGFRKTYGFNAGQLHPEINYDNLLPLVSFGGSALQNTPDFGNWQAGRFPQQEKDLLLYIQDGFTFTKNKHTFKAGVYAEKDRIATGSGFQTLPYGSLSFNVDVNNPGDSRHPFANALLGNFQTYTESEKRTKPAAVALNVDWYVQDSWKVTKNLTLEIGLRVANFQPWFGWHGFSTSFAPERYNPKDAPLLYQPTRVNNVRLALDPRNGTTRPAALIGSFVPGTGNVALGTVTSKDPNYPRGFYENAGELFQPRFGFAWDVFGTGKTAIRGGFSQQNQSARYEPSAAGAPLNYTPVYYYGSLNTFLNASGDLAPGTITGHDRYRKTPTVYNISFGVQQDVGGGTVLDAKYVSTLGRNLPTTRAINTIPYGARFLDINPQNQDPGANAGTVLPNNFLVPFPGYSAITLREAGGSSNYHALQGSLNRRFSRGLQFGVSYAWSKVMDYGGAMPIYRTAKVWNYGKAGFDQTHVLTINYSYDIPKASKLVNHMLVRSAFDNWQISGITSFSSGTPAGIGLTLSDGADLTGGGDGNSVNVIADPRISHSERGFDKMFNTAAFARPVRGVVGNAAVESVRGPGVTNFDVTLFKNFPIRAEKETIQLRWEVYNLFNHTQFSGMNTSATFNAAGVQTNTAFGQATAARAARIMQVSLRFRF